jgi:putative membrane protein
VQLKGYRGADNDPAAGTGTAALAQALELLESAASDPVQGLVPLSVVKDKIAKIRAGAQKLDAGASQLQAGAEQLNAGAARLDAGAGQLHAGTGKLTAGFSTLAGRLNSTDPNNPGVVMGTRLLAEGTAKLRVGMDGVPGDPAHPGLLKATARITQGSSRLAAGTSALNAGIKGDPAKPDSPGLLSGSRALAAGASKLSDGNTRLAAGSTRLASGAVKLADGNARIAEGTGTLHSAIAAVSPSNHVGQSDAAMAVALVGVLSLGSVAAYLILRNRGLRIQVLRNRAFRNPARNSLPLQESP